MSAQNAWMIPRAAADGYPAGVMLDERLGPKWAGLPVQRGVLSRRHFMALPGRDLWPYWRSGGDISLLRAHFIPDRRGNELKEAEQCTAGI